MIKKIIKWLVFDYNSVEQTQKRNNSEDKINCVMRSYLDSAAADLANSRRK